MRFFMKQQDGFTLIEVTISLLILAIGLTSLLGMQATGLRLNRVNKVNEVGKDILVSEVDRIMPLSNLQLATKTKVGDADSLTSLGSDFQLSGIDTSIPTGFDYVRWKGVKRSFVKGGQPSVFVVKIAIDKKFLLQDILARGQVSVFWPSAARSVDTMQTTFFVQRK